MKKTTEAKGSINFVFLNWNGIKKNLRIVFLIVLS